MDNKRLLLVLVIALAVGKTGVEFEFMDVVVLDMAEVVEVLELIGAETKISSCAPGAHPMPELYPGLTPLGGETLFPVA
jgi:hypothetical protein